MKRIKIIYTGGTIGGKLLEGQQVVSEDLKPKLFMEYLRTKLPDDLMRNIDINMSTPLKKFSEEMIPSDWCLIANAVFEAVMEGASGIVVAHGTDTLSYTSAALSFLVGGLKVPVVLTGSNLPLMDEETDAIRNLTDSIFVACNDMFRGVFLVFSGQVDVPSTIHLGSRVRKMRFEGNCYESINTEPIGRITFRRFGGQAIQLINESLLRRVVNKNEAVPFGLTTDRLSTNISFVRIYPGFDPGLIRWTIIRNNPVAGSILELYNGGTGCTQATSYSLIEPIALAVKRKSPVFVVSQHHGRVDMSTYPSSIELRKAGAHPLQDMITEAAIPKLMWVLGRTNKYEEVVNMMLTDIAGEISDSR